MKKFSTFVIMSFFLLVACTKESSTDDLLQQINELKAENENLIEQLEQANHAYESLAQQLESPMYNEYGKIKAKKIIDLPKNLYKEDVVDIDMDGKEEKIELYVTAEKLEDGTFAWDDGHRWVLIVNDQGETYPLFDQFVQLGSVDFVITNIEDRVSIVVLMTSPMNKYFQTFSYEPKENGYEKTTFYQRENMLNQYNESTAIAFFHDAYDLYNEAFDELEIILEKIDDIELADQQQRLSLFNPIYTKLFRSNSLFTTIGELEPKFYINLDSFTAFFNQIIIDEPTEEQLETIKQLYKLNKEYVVREPLIEEENKVNQSFLKKLTEMDQLLSNFND